MKKRFSTAHLVVAFILCLVSSVSMRGAVFTTDTVIGSGNTNFDGMDIVISNCTVTMDGAHSFSNLLVGPGGVLTHTFSTNGLVTFEQTNTNEPQVLTGTNAVTLLDSGPLLAWSVTDAGQTITYTDTVDYLIFNAGSLVQLQRTTNSAIPDGATVLVTYTVQKSAPALLNVSIGGNLEVAPGGAVNANGGGLSGGTGKGNSSASIPISGSGGGYGGNGGQSSSNAVPGVAYGAVENPLSPGSGGGAGAGGPGGRGGGVIKLAVSGAAIVNGVISANGADATNNRAGGGSGGSILLVAPTLTGSGSFSANGGAGEPVHGGGGGGGRIAFYLNTFSTNSFSGTMICTGGAGFVKGGAGTVFFDISGPNEIFIDNGGLPGGTTPIPQFATASVTIAGGAIGTATGGTFGHLLITANSKMIAASATPVTLSVLDSVVIEAGGGIFFDGAGSPPRQGQGAGGSFTSGLNTIGAGAGHGGYGGSVSNNLAPGGNFHGLISNPGTLGSGGGGLFASTNLGGAGGGAFRMIVARTLTLDGTISANGNPAVGNNGGGGSGGSIWLTSTTISGSGTISANGGSGMGSAGGGAGGGRILIEYQTNLFTGPISATGGAGSSPGGAGTILWRQPGGSNPQRLTIENGGLAGTNTPVTLSATTDLIVSNRAIAIFIGTSLPNFSSLVIASNSFLMHAGSFIAPITVQGNVLIQPGGGLISDGVITSSGGPGGGGVGGAGGGHGGYGGIGANSPFGGPGPGGNSYGLFAMPQTSGSAGSTLFGSSPVGGAGGGGFRMTVNGTLTLDGQISANGLAGTNTPAGGGSGGSVWLTLGRLTGSGLISANGGPGNAGGGGGGGGRIAVYLNTNLFSGTVTAYGGSGFRSGGAGTVYLKTNGANSGFLRIDNGGGLNSTNTPVNPAPADDLTVQGNAIAASQSMTCRNLIVASNGGLVIAGMSFNTLTVANATVQEGGFLSADGIGSLPLIGPGRIGGGHGGYGGGGASIGNIISGHVQMPSGPGGGGVNGSGSSTAPFGGRGGGVARLIVSQTLLINGRVSANGLAGDLNSGGGAGGSLWITTTTLAGSGQVAANGGAGGPGVGCGGGGGRIAVYYSSNLFSGTLSAHGGGGLIRGGAGTVYTKANNQLVGPLIVDNGGASGTNTLLSSPFGLPTQPFDLTVQGGGTVHSTALTLSNLTVRTGGMFTALPGQSVNLSILTDAFIDSTASIAVDGSGSLAANGAGRGNTVSSKGSGAGYGGMGGNSGSGALGGTNYGSAMQPQSLGSGGGLGSGPPGGSQGGGVLRLAVGGTLTLNGRLGANGNTGIQDDSGGGSGGSILVTAKSLNGNGLINADGGDGDLFGGGGGGGGRIAIYSISNAFTGTITADGGNGAAPGQDGTIFNSTAPQLSIVSQTPIGTISNGVSSVEVVFDTLLNPATVDLSDLLIVTPQGVLQTNVSHFLQDNIKLRAEFPLQTSVGNYAILVGPQITDIFGRTMSQVYTGAFTVVLPTIQGTITDTNGQPVSGVVLQPSGGQSSGTTDATGTYTLGVVSGWSGTVVPSLDGFLFVPGSRSYTNVTAPVSSEDYLAVTSFAPTVSAALQNTNLLLNWHGIAGVEYQLFSSTNLLNWLPYNGPIIGSNSIVSIPLPISNDPKQFFRVRANN